MGWSLAATLVERTGFIIVNLLLVRLLVPRDFGLFGTVTVFTGVAALIADFGFSSALIHKRDATDLHLSSAFWVNLAFGVLLSLGLALGAPLLAWFYADPDVARVAWAMSPVFLISAMSQTPTALLRKRLQIKRLAVVQVSASLLAGLAALTAACLGLGVASLVVQSLGGGILVSIGLWIASGWRPHLQISRAALHELAAFGSQVVAFTIVAYALRTIDRVLIGRFVGMAPLGVYGRSHDLIMLLITVVSVGVSRTLFPALARMQRDHAASAQLYLCTVRSVALVTFPAMIGLFVASEPFVRFVFGSAWLEMIPLLRILTWIGLIESIGTLNGNIYLSQGRTALQLKVGIVLGLAGLSAICAGIPWGIRGVAWGYAVYAGLSLYPSLRIAGGLIGLTFMDVVRAVQVTLLYSLAMGAFVFAVDRLLLGTLGAGARLAADAMLGLTVYTVATGLTRRQVLSDVRALTRGASPAA